MQQAQDFRLGIAQCSEGFRVFVAHKRIEFLHPLAVRFKLRDFGVKLVDDLRDRRGIIVRGTGGHARSIAEIVTKNALVIE
jgi:hypothetical protein